MTLLLAVVVAANGFGSFYTDIKPEVYLAPWDTLVRYASAWTSSPYLGSANFNVGLFPVLVIVGVLRSAGLDPEWAFKVFHFCLWFCAAWGANRFLRNLVPQAGRWAGLVAGVVYIANPYQIQAGSTLAILLPLALLPWLLLSFLHALSARVGWAWPAIFGLTFFWMSGMNVAVVPVLQLIALVPLILLARIDWKMRWIDLVKVTGKCALFVVGVSLYWLVPARAAVSTGRQIVLQSETLDGIAKVSSFSEVLRGMGMWSLYGRDANGPWLPQTAVFLVSTWVMLITMLWPTLSVLALRWVPAASRRVVVGWVALASVLMVGIFPGADNPASPFGWLLRAILANPAASAFRTTNKVGAVLALAFAVALGLGAQHWAHRLRSIGGAAPLAFSMCVVVLAAWSLPALTNRLYTSPMNIPSYWYAAAKAADKGDPNSRVLFLPGQVRPTYRWTPQRPDDLPNSLLKRDAILPETSPNASAPGGNYLAAMDDALQSGVLGPDTMSTYARYLGADKILLRHDTVWEQDGGIRPSAVDRIISADPGLFGEANFGQPGEYVFGPGTNANANGEGLMYPVQLYDVQHATTATRATADDRSIVVAGDGWAVAQLASNGLLSTSPSFRYAADTTSSTLVNQLGAGHTLVITDTNARRAAIPNRLTNGEGSLLAANESAPNMRSLGTAADQTVLARSGATVTASSRGGAFFDLPYAAPENILDGDPSTSWLFGDFDRAVGQSATITQPTPVRLGTIRVQQTQYGPVHIDKLTVTAGGRSITQAMPDTGYADFAFGDTTTDKVKLTVSSLRGDGYSLVGISDVQMPGALAGRAARTPLTFQHLYSGLSSQNRAAFDATPLDVLLSRYQGTASLTDDAEKVFRRIVTLPDARTFEPSASVRVEGDVQTAYDDVAGYSRAVTATSSDFYFRNANARASMAVDGKADTAWVPGGTVDGSWWQLTGPKRSISSVTLDQEKGFDDHGDTQWVDSAVVTVDGRQVATSKLKRGGRTTIKFAAVKGQTVRVTLRAAVLPRTGPPPRFPSIDTGLQMRKLPKSALGSAKDSEGRCLTVATVDGQPLSMRPATETIAGSDSQGTKWVACAPLTLAAGEHRIDQAAGFTVDAMALTDTQTRSNTATTDPVVKIVKDTAAAKTMRVAAAGPFNVIVGQSYDSRWRATANGKDLGAPIVLDGYSTGWRVPAGGRYTIEMSYTPQRSAYLAAGASALVVLLGAGLIIVALVRRKLFAHETDESAPDDLDPQRSSSGRAVPRPVREITLIALAGLAVGWPGAVAGAVVVIAGRRRVKPRLLLWVGAGLLFISMPLYLLLIGSKRGTVNADAVAVSMWPHWTAGAGLVLALSAALLLSNGAQGLLGRATDREQGENR